MTYILAVVVGVLYGVAIYLMLRRNLAQLILGLALLTNAANLMIFTVGGLVRGNPPLIPEGEVVPAAGVADPVPQALILTSIVIGFGVLAFALALAYRVNQAVPSDDLDAMHESDEVVLPTAPMPAERFEEWGAPVASAAAVSAGERP